MEGEVLNWRRKQFINNVGYFSNWKDFQPNNLSSSWKMKMSYAGDIV